MMSATAGNIFREETEIWRPGRLWSLLDMLKVSATAYVKLGKRIEEGRMILFMVENMNVAWNDQEKTRMRKTMRDIHKHSSTLKLETTEEVFAEWLEHDNLPQTSREWDLMTDVVTKELSRKLFLFVPKHKAEFYESDSLLSDSAITSFPLAGGELRAAGNSFSADLNTACVFHCMRALEHGLRALAADVDVNWDVQQWHVVINEIESAIKKQANTLPRGQKKGERLQFLSESAKEFSYFKDGWRNYASHGKATYEEAQALSVMNHVRSFFEILSSRLSESS